MFRDDEGDTRVRMLDADDSGMYTPQTIMLDPRLRMKESVSPPPEPSRWPRRGTPPPSSTKPVRSREELDYLQEPDMLVDVIVSLMHDLASEEPETLDKLKAMFMRVAEENKVLPIGGLKEKLLAAHRGGIKLVLIPEDNEKDLVDIPKAILKKIEVRPVSTIDDVLELALVENIQRADLNAVEEAAGYKQLMDRFGHTQEKLAEALGKSRSHIANQVRLLSLPDDVQTLLQDGKLTAGLVDLTWFPTRNFGAAIGYNIWDLGVEASKESLTGRVDYEYKGPKLTLALRL